MEIHGLSPLQHEIADRIWNSESESEVEDIIAQYGSSAVTVHELMIAAHYDDAIQGYDDVELAQQVIDNLCK